MKVEEVLIELGQSPLSTSPYSRVLLTLLNAYIPGETPITEQSSGLELLSMIYKMSDMKRQEKILNKNLGVIRSTDSYRTALLTMATLFGAVVMWMAVCEVVDDLPTVRDVWKAVWNFLI